MWQLQHRKIYRSDQYCVHKANYLPLIIICFLWFILWWYWESYNWFWTQMKIFFYPWYKKTLNYFTKFLQGYMNLVIVLVAILYQKVSKRRALRNIEKCQGSLILLIQKNGSVSPNDYEADKSCHIG